MNRFSLNPLFSKFLIASVILTAGWIAFMRYETKPFTSEEIVRFEFAGTPEHASEIIKDWNEREWVPLAIHSLYLDFIFIFLYTATLALGCLTFPSLTGKINLINWGMKLYRFSLYAGLADFFENLCLLEVLYDDHRAFFPAAAWALAFIKFTIVVAVLLFLLRCIIHWVVNRIRE
jgi:hypothetical protein